MLGSFCCRLLLAEIELRCIAGTKRNQRTCAIWSKKITAEHTPEVIVSVMDLSL